MAELGLQIRVPVEAQQRGSRLTGLSSGLGSREICGNYQKKKKRKRRKKSPLSKARLRGCRDGLRTGLGRGDSSLHPRWPPTQIPAGSRRRHFRQPTRPGLSPRPDHPPWGALTAQRVPPLPPPSPKWRRRRPPSFSSPSSRLGIPPRLSPSPASRIYFSAW